MAPHLPLQRWWTHLAALHAGGDGEDKWMSWHYLQEQEVACWDQSCLDGAPDALLSLIPMPAESWPVEPQLGRVAHGVAHRVDRLKAIGNGQVPHVAALAWRILGWPIK